MNKNKIIGIVVFIVLIVVIIVIGILKNSSVSIVNTNLTDVYVATGGGKEDFLADEEVQKILKKKYKLNVVYDSWSNGKTVLWPLIREQVGYGNKDVINRIKAGEAFTINSEGVSKYDALFTSDQRFYDYYKLSPNKEKGEADRYYVTNGSI